MMWVSNLKYNFDNSTVGRLPSCHQPLSATPPVIPVTSSGVRAFSCLLALSATCAGIYSWVLFHCLAICHLCPSWLPVSRTDTRCIYTPALQCTGDTLFYIWHLGFRFLTSHICCHFCSLFYCALYLCLFCAHIGAPLTSYPQHPLN